MKADKRYDTLTIVSGININSIRLNSSLLRSLSEEISTLQRKKKIYKLPHCIWRRKICSLNYNFVQKKTKWLVFQRWQDVLLPKFLCNMEIESHYVVITIQSLWIIAPNCDLFMNSIIEKNAAKQWCWLPEVYSMQRNDKK